MKFIHAADLHLDSPLKGLDAYEGAPVDRLRGASRAALTALVDLAIARAVDLVLLAGDIYDGDWTDFRTGLFFRGQLQRLSKAGIRVFIVKGNHDAQSLITRTLPAVDGVHVLSSRRCETVDLAALGVAVHGRSFAERSTTEDLLPGYPAAVPGRFNIGMLHTSLNGREGHDPYAPTTLAALVDKGYDYFALGHVHAREVVRDAAPRIVFPGNLQGRHARETGPKGCELVTVEGGRIVTAEFVALDVVRWHRIEIDATGLHDVEALARRFRERMQAAAADAPEHLHAVRVRLGGESALHAIEAAQPGCVQAAIQAACQDLDACDAWIEQVRCELRSPFDRGAAAARDDALGEVVRLVDALASDDGQLLAWFAAQMAEMKELPAALADADPARLTLPQVRALLADAEATVLARLAGVMGDAGRSAERE
ncbi:MAG: exonuclease SbcCD subunit D [Lautropia sp.]